MDIRSRKDLEFAYSFRRFLQTNTNKLPLLPGETDKTPELIKDMSEAIHKYNRKRESRRLANSDRRTIKTYDDSPACIVRIDSIEDLPNIDEAREWFEQEEYIHYRPSYYDCTGQLFTQWYRIFRHPDGHFIFYHYIACDC